MILSREIAGWVLVTFGLLTFVAAFFLLIAYGMIVQSGPMVFAGFIIFRGGIHLLKVALAAKVCQSMPEGNAPKLPRRTK